MNHSPPSTALLLLAAGCVLAAAAPAAGQDPRERRLADVTALTSDGDNGEAYWNGTGTRLVWQSNRGGRECDKIWIMEADGSGKRMVSPDRGAHTCAFFLPGDEQIVFASTSHLPGTCPPKPEVKGPHRYVWPLHPYDLYTANLDGSGLTRLTDNPRYDAEPVVRADGRIVFGSQREGDFDVYAMDADGSNLVRLTDRIGYDGGPWWSPDGKRIVWRAWYPETPEENELWAECMANDYIVAVPLDLWVMAEDGSNKRRILRNGATNWAPSWHPDGERIVFSSNMDDWREELGAFGHNFELYLIGADGSGLERLTYNGTFDSFPMFSPDGKRLAFGSNRNPLKPRATDVFVADWVE